MNKRINTFSTEDAYNIYIASEIAQYPNIGYISETNNVVYKFRGVQPVDETIPLTFKITEGTGTIQIVNVHGTTVNNNKTFLYSLNDGDFTQYEFDNVINVTAGDTVAFTSPDELVVSESQNVYRYFVIDGCNCDVYGNILSLLNYIDKEHELGNYCFSRLFMNNQNIFNAERLLLPSINLGTPTGVYRYLFSNCSNLLTAPEVLPATKITTYTYQHMFEGTAITHSPFIYVDELTKANSMGNMFENCSNLTEIYCNTSNFYDYNGGLIGTSWLNGVPETGTFYKNVLLDVTVLSERNAGNIPSGWTIVDWVQ